MNLSEADLTQIKFEVIKYIKNNLRITVDEDYDYYSGKDITIKLILNDEEISQVYFGVQA